jgi:hypothetical protein
MVSCSGPQEVKVLSSEVTIPVETVETITPDSSLYRANVGDWNQASIKSRKANCASMILSAVDTTEFREERDIHELTEGLFKCIDEVTYGMPTMNNNAIMDVSARCLHSMGYKLSSQHTSLN